MEIYLYIFYESPVMMKLNLAIARRKFSLLVCLLFCEFLYFFVYLSLVYLLVYICYLWISLLGIGHSNTPVEFWVIIFKTIALYLSGNILV